MKKVTVGDCTLYLGDCRDVASHFPDNSIDMIFTDPPYGHNNNDGDLIHNIEKAIPKRRNKRMVRARTNQDDARPIANDGFESATELVTWLFSESPRLLASGGCCCCCGGGGGGPDPQFARWALMMDDHLAFKQMIVWDKGPMGMGWHYRRSYETILVGNKKGGPCKWHDDTMKIENIIRPGNYGIRKIIPSIDQHPTEKPPELPMLFIRLHSLPGEVIFDPFMGTGSTGVASLRLGRKFIGVELDPKFFDHACRRIKRANRSGKLEL